MSESDTFRIILIKLPIPWWISIFKIQCDNLLNSDKYVTRRFKKKFSLVQLALISGTQIGFTFFFGLIFAREIRERIQAIKVCPRKGSRLNKKKLCYVVYSYRSTVHDPWMISKLLILGKNLYIRCG